MVGRHKTREPEWSTQMREIAVNEHKLSPDPQWNNQETIKKYVGKLKLFGDGPVCYRQAEK